MTNGKNFATLSTGQHSIQVILFEIDCAIFYTNFHELFRQFISWTEFGNSGKSSDNFWMSYQVMANMEKFYGDLIIINLYQSNYMSFSLFQVPKKDHPHHLSQSPTKTCPLQTNWPLGVQIWKRGQKGVHPHPPRPKKLHLYWIRSEQEKT